MHTYLGVTQLGLLLGQPACAYGEAALEELRL